MSILLTGGTGYIGSHTAVELISAGFDVVLFDNLSNSDVSVVDRIEKITGKRPIFVKGDVCSKEDLRKVFSEYSIDAVIHFAGYKAVGESVEKPLMYYENNIYGALCVLSVMKSFGCTGLIFSSSATVYGEENKVPFTEDMRTGGCTNPYGQTKFMIEQIIKDVVASDDSLSCVTLRYFNPIGAHRSGLLAEQPKGVPNNLMPYIVQVAKGQRDVLHVFGNDYPTKDGTGERDYIHVVDLAKGHVEALKYVLCHKGLEVVNLGTGMATSVLEVVAAYEKASGVKIKYEISPRRPGDLACCFADASKAKRLLGWSAEYSVEDACRDSHNAN